MPNRKQAIVNADDFGWSDGVTEGILLAHREGIVTSTTIVANMPAAAKAAGRLGGSPELGVGVHLNVCQGPPLSREGLRLAGEDGVMARTATAVVLACMVRPSLLAAVEAEFDAQIRWALDAGIRPTHLDSHRHVHAFWPVFRRVARLAGKYGIPFVRRHRERLSGRGWPRAPKGRRRSRLLTFLGRANNLWSSGLYATTGTWGVEHTGLIDAGWLIRVAEALGPGVTEIMTHPGLPEGLDGTTTRLIASRAAELDALRDPAVKDAFERNRIELTHYGRLRR